MAATSITDVKILAPPDLLTAISEAKNLLMEVKSLKESLRVEAPMTKEVASQFMRCSIRTLDKKYRHLRHMVDGTPYWYASELNAYIKSHKPA